METSLIRELLSTISERSPFQAKALDGLMDKLSEEEKEGLSSLISSHTARGDTVEYLAACYLNFIGDFMEEHFYFVKNGHYRYSSSAEANKFFYQNPDYMEYYMKGLAISVYLFDYHRKCRQWYREKIGALDAGSYWLEVGVGHGEYFALALQHTNFKHYLGIDISPTSVQMCRELAEQRSPAGSKNITIRVQDFFQYDGPVCDAVVLGEILEHVEKPCLFLEKIYEITHEGSFIYITTAVNSPQKDHIFLFRSVEEVEKLYQEAGFDICDRLICPANGYTMERAVKERTSITTAHVLKKRSAVFEKE